MAKVALKYATGPETKRMARIIIEAREKGVAGMQAWVKNNGP